MVIGSPNLTRVQFQSPPRSIQSDSTPPEIADSASIAHARSFDASDVKMGLATIVAPTAAAIYASTQSGIMPAIVGGCLGAVGGSILLSIAGASIGSKIGEGANNNTVAGGFLGLAGGFVAGAVAGASLGYGADGPVSALTMGALALGPMSIGGFELMFHHR